MLIGFRNHGSITTQPYHQPHFHRHVQHGIVHVFRVVSFKNTCVNKRIIIETHHATTTFACQRTAANSTYLCVDSRLRVTSPPLACSAKLMSKKPIFLEVTFHVMISLRMLMRQNFEAKIPDSSSELSLALKTDFQSHTTGEDKY